MPACGKGKNSEEVKHRIIIPQKEIIKTTIEEQTNIPATEADLLENPIVISKIKWFHITEILKDPEMIKTPLLRKIYWGEIEEATDEIMYLYHKKPWEKDF